MRKERPPVAQSVWECLNFYAEEKGHVSRVRQTRPWGVSIGGIRPAARVAVA